MNNLNEGLGENKQPIKKFKPSKEEDLKESIEITKNITIEDLKKRFPVLTEGKISKNSKSAPEVPTDEKLKELAELMNSFKASSLSQTEILKNKYVLMLQIIKIGSYMESVVGLTQIKNEQDDGAKTALKDVKEIEKKQLIAELESEPQRAIFQVARNIVADCFHLMYLEQTVNFIQNFSLTCDGKINLPLFIKIFDSSSFKYTTESQLNGFFDTNKMDPRLKYFKTKPEQSYTKDLPLLLLVGDGLNPALYVSGKNFMGDVITTDLEIGSMSVKVQGYFRNLITEAIVKEEYMAQKFSNMHNITEPIQNTVKNAIRKKRGHADLTSEGREKINKYLHQIAHFLTKFDLFKKENNYDAAYMALIAAGTCARKLPHLPSDIFEIITKMRNDIAHMDYSSENVCAESQKKILTFSGQDIIKEIEKNLKITIELDKYKQTEEGESPRAISKKNLGL